MIEPPRLTSLAFQPSTRTSPVRIGFCCILVALAVLTGALAFTGGRGVLFGSWYQPYATGWAISLLIAAWGLWRRKAWGPRALAALLAVDTGLSWFAGQASLALTAISVLLAVAGFMVGRIE